jgi:cystathionine beta-synthase
LPIFATVFETSQSFGLFIDRPNLNNIKFFRQPPYGKPTFLMHYYNTILDTIGNTPLVKINKMAEGIPALVLAKIESFNPGHSIKDRIGLKMVLDAEASGLLQPGGTIIEATSGNTGMGIAQAAIVKGYKVILTMTTKVAKEKVDNLRALGVTVMMCPYDVEPEHPESYYSVAARLANEIPNSVWTNQYDNLANRTAHYEGTGPEIWEQTDGKITHFIATAGTCGTLTGTAMYLKEKNPNIQVWGIDTYGSVLAKYHATGEVDVNERYSYLSEGFGKDTIPANFDPSVVDHMEKVTDKDGALVCREMAWKEGLFMGYSAGSTLQGLLQLKDRFKEGDVAVMIFHDHGSRYVSKIFNDDWMREKGLLD